MGEVSAASWCVGGCRIFPFSRRGVVNLLLVQGALAEVGIRWLLLRVRAQGSRGLISLAGHLHMALSVEEALQSAERGEQQSRSLPRRGGVSPVSSGSVNVAALHLSYPSLAGSGRFAALYGAPSQETG